MPETNSPLDLNLVCAEWPQSAIKGIYLNSGSCGVKPASVVRALTDGIARLNENPTIVSFFTPQIWENARAAAARLIAVPAQDLMLTCNTTYGIQMVMQSLLLKPGDEFVTTNREHSSVTTFSRYLSEKRGIIVRHHNVDAFAGSKALTEGILDLLTPRTRLVLVSEINCLTGWRPRLSSLAAELASAQVPLLVDGAHAPGQGPLEISTYPFWVGSAHKWMGAPNGCGFLYANPAYRELLIPLTIGDRLYNESVPPVHRLEWPGTADVVKLMGLEAAAKLQLELTPEKIVRRQHQLHAYLRSAMESLSSPELRTPWVDGETSALFACYWDRRQLRVDDLQASLWNERQIWIQQDYASDNPGYGMRISCNIFNTEAELDRLVAGLKTLLV